MARKRKPEAVVPDEVIPRDLTDVPLATFDPAEGRGVPITPEQVAMFLAVLTKTGSIAAAAKAAHPAVTPSSADRQFRTMIARDADLAQRVRSAMVQCQAALEAMLTDHALNGVDKPIYQGGVLVGHETVFDHNLALKLVRRNARLLGDTSWEDKPVEETPDDKPKVVIDFRSLPPDQRRALLEARRALLAADATANPKDPVP